MFVEEYEWLFHTTQQRYDDEVEERSSSTGWQIGEQSESDK